MKLSNIELRRAIHIMLYGPPKVGKTELYGELAEHGFNLYIFDFENGTLTLKRSISKEAQDRVEIYQIPDTKFYPIAGVTATKVMKPGVHKICHTHGSVSCSLCAKDPTARTSTFDNTKLTEKDIVIFDSLNQLTTSVMNHITKDIKDEDFKPGWDEYRAQGTRLDAFLSCVQNAPYHVICTTHELDLAKDKEPTEIVPLVGSRNFARNVAKYFDEVVHMHISNLAHRAYSDTLYSKNHLTGSRSRTRIEDQVTANINKKPGDKEHTSLLPIFLNAGISGDIKAETILKSILTGTQTK